MWLTPFLLEHHYICEIPFFTPLNDLLDLEVFSWVVLHIWDRYLQLLQKIKNVLDNKKAKSIKVILVEFYQFQVHVHGLSWKSHRERQKTL